jgi:hypothetical protein
MESFFNPSIDKITSTAQEMLQAAGGITESIILVGGFSGSMYAKKKIRQALERNGATVITPTYSRSAVLEGKMAVAYDLFQVESA